MKWIEWAKEKPNLDNFGIDTHFLATDGKDIYIMYLDKRNDIYLTTEVLENEFAVEKRLTHWGCIKSIHLPTEIDNEMD